MEAPARAALQARLAGTSTSLSVLNPWIDTPGGQLPAGPCASIASLLTRRRWPARRRTVPTERREDRPLDDRHLDAVLVARSEPALERRPIARRQAHSYLALPAVVGTACPGLRVGHRKGSGLPSAQARGTPQGTTGSPLRCATGLGLRGASQKRRHLALRPQGAGGVAGLRRVGTDRRQPRQLLDAPPCLPKQLACTLWPHGHALQAQVWHSCRTRSQSCSAWPALPTVGGTAQASCSSTNKT